MGSKPSVTLTIAGDEKRLTDALQRSTASMQKFSSDVTKSTSDMATKAEAHTSRLSKSFQNAGTILMAQGAAFAANQAVNFLRGMTDEAREAEKVARSTAQGIATMGAASWTSAAQVAELAEQLSNKIGVDDEAIQQSANLLLTFGNVKNVAGDMNNVFDRAVMATQDLAAKGFGDADAAAKMLGKALNDPIKGMTALGRAGVTFSDAQKKQIERMVESGNLLGAQKVLLAEVEKQVGGTAEATADAGDKMAVRWANFQEQLGTAVLPILNEVLSKLMEFLDWAQQNPEIVAAIGAVTAAIWLLNAAMNANPVVLITTLIAGLVVGLMLLWNKSEGFRAAVMMVWDNIRDKVGAVVDFIKNLWNGVVGFFQSLPGKIGAALSGLGGIISSAFKAAVNFAVDMLNRGIDLINRLIAGINVINPFSDIPNIPHIPRMHQGGVIGGAPGTEVLRVLQAGEEVVPRGGSGSGAVEVRITGSGVLFDAFQAGLTDGSIVLVGR